MTRRLILLIAALAGTSGAGCGAFEPRLPDDPTARHEAIARAAWGPESPETLQKYLESRAALDPIYRNYEDGIQNWALREAATGRVFGPTLIGVASMRKRIDDEAGQRGLTFDDYQRLTILVYGRWLRATRDPPVPEERVVRTLKEIEVGLARQLENAAHSDDVSIDTAALEARLASVRHQAKYLEPYATMDRQATLDAIDPATRAWLGEHRAEIEKLDWAYFDTVPPPRAEEKKKT
jgi:hypothetical protein